MRDLFKSKCLRGILISLFAFCWILHTTLTYAESTPPQPEQLVPGPILGLLTDLNHELARGPTPKSPSTLRGDPPPCFHFEKQDICIKDPEKSVQEALARLKLENTDSLHLYFTNGVLEMGIALIPLEVNVAGIHLSNQVLSADTLKTMMKTQPDPDILASSYSPIFQFNHPELHTLFLRLYTIDRIGFLILPNAEINQQKMDLVIGAMIW